MSNDITDEEKKLFRQSQQSTTRLKPYGKVIHQQEKILPRITQNNEPSDATELDIKLDVAKVSSETPLQFHRSGVQPRTIRQLRQGKLLPEATLDLHGATIIEAEALLDKFLKTALLRKKRVIHIIHGKGHTSKQQFPPLKNAVNAFLQRHPKVLAFSSTPISDGGTGAVYVLLKKTMAD